MKDRLIFGTWIGYWLFVIWAFIVFGIQNYFFEYENTTKKIISLVVAWLIFGLGLKCYPWIDNRIKLNRKK